MHITLPAAELRAARAIVEKATDRVMVIPILGHTLFEAEPDLLRLTATDMDLAVSIEIRHPCLSVSAIALPSEKLKGICAALPGEDVEIKLGDSQCSIKSGGASFRVNTLPAGDFPRGRSLSALTGVKCFEIPAVELRRLLSRTAFAMSTEETRYYLNGVHLVHKHDALVVEATNGHIVARAEADLPDGAMDIDILIPAKTVERCPACPEGPRGCRQHRGERAPHHLRDRRRTDRLAPDRRHVSERRSRDPARQPPDPDGERRRLPAAVSAAAVVGEVKKDSGLRSRSARTARSR